MKKKVKKFDFLIWILMEVVIKTPNNLSLRQFFDIDRILQT